MINFEELQNDKENWNIENFINLKPSVEDLKRKMDSIMMNLLKVDQNIPSNYTQKDNVMNIDSKTVKDQFKNFLEHCKERLEKFLILKFKENIKEIQALVIAGEEATKIRKYDIKSFCITKEKITEFEAAPLVQLNEACIRMDTLQQSIRLYKLDVPKNMREVDTSLVVSVTEVEEASNLLGKYEYYNDKKNETLAEITNKKKALMETHDQDLESHKSKITEYTEELTTKNEVFFDIDTPKDKILNELNIMDNKIKYITKEINTINGYKKILEKGEEEIIKDEKLEKLQQKFDARNKLWNSLINLQEESMNWNKNYLSEIRTLKIEDKIKEYELISSELNQEINQDVVEDRVFHYFKAEVENVKNISPYYNRFKSA